MLIVLAETKEYNKCVFCVSQLGQGTVCCVWWMWDSTIWRSHQLNSQMILSMSARLQKLPCAPAEPNSPFSVSVCVCVRERARERNYVALGILLRKYYTGVLSNNIQIQKNKAFCHVLLKLLFVMYKSLYRSILIRSFQNMNNIIQCKSGS